MHCRHLNHTSARSIQAVNGSALASHAIEQRVCSTAADGCTKAASHAAHHNVAHATSEVADLISSAYLGLFLGDGLFWTGSCWLTTCILHPQIRYVQACEWTS